MNEKPSFYRQHRLALIVALIIGLGPLTALSLGSMFAGEETLARAEAGDRHLDLDETYREYELPKMAGEAADTSVIDIIDGAAPFQRFNDLVREADLTTVLEGKGPFTLFVPTNEAFQRESGGNDGGSVDLVSRHVASGRYGVTELMDMDRVETLNGHKVAVGGGNLSVGGAEIVKSNLLAGNGVVHIVDGIVQ